MHTDKPTHLALKDYIIRRQSAKLRVPESTIHAVISHQFASAHQALSLHDDVELSGLGKFIFRRTKAEYKLHDFINMEGRIKALLNSCDDRKKKTYESKLANIEREIEEVKQRLSVNNELDKGNSGGVEKRFDSSRKAEGSNREDVSREAPDM